MISFIMRIKYIKYEILITYNYILLIYCPTLTSRIVIFNLDYIKLLHTKSFKTK